MRPSEDKLVFPSSQFGVYGLFFFQPLVFIIALSSFMGSSSSPSMSRLEFENISSLVVSPNGVIVQ